MRKWIISLVIFCALTVGVFVLVANVINSTDTGIDKSNWKKINDIYNYQIVYDDAEYAEAVQTYSNLYFENNPGMVLYEGLKSFSPSWELNLKTRTEYEQVGSPIKDNPSIILYKRNNVNINDVVNTSLGESDFIIRYVTGGNIEINALNNQSILAGVNFFLNECVVCKDDGTKDIYVPTGEKGYHFDFFEGYNKIDGEDISKFKIVVNDLEAESNNGVLEKAQQIQKKICDISNVFVPIVPEYNKIDKIDAGKYDSLELDSAITPINVTQEQVLNSFTYTNEIYISSTSGLRADALNIMQSFSNDQYYVGVKSGKLYILGQNSIALNQACDYFISWLNKNIKEGRYIRFTKENDKEGVAKYNSTVDLYVEATNGNDENNGLDSSLAVKTLERAIEIFNEEKVKYNNNFTKFNIYLKNGSYYANNLEISAPHNISVNLIGEEGAVINSLQTITPAKEAAAKYYTYKFSVTSSQPIPQIRQLYSTVNGSTKLMPLAESSVYSDSVTVNTAYNYPIDNQNNRIYIDSALYNKINGKIEGDEDYEEIWLSIGNKSFNLKISGAGTANLNLDGTGTTTCYYVTVAEETLFNKMYDQIEDVLVNGSVIARSYSIKNCLEFITENSIVFDSNGSLAGENRIYTVYFGGNTSQKTISYAEASTLLNLSGSQDVTISNITFTGVEYKDVVTNGQVFGNLGIADDAFINGGAIFANGAKNLTIKNCNFKDINTNAINIKGSAENLIIENNEFSDIGMSAIFIGDEQICLNYEDWMANAIKNVKIINNKLTTIANLYPAFSAITLTRCDVATIKNNTITTVGGNAISVGYGESWRDVKYNYMQSVNLNRVEISFNHITDFVKFLKDGGAVFVQGANCKKEYTNIFNFISNNYVKNDSVTDGSNINVYYFTGGASNWQINNNVAGGGICGVFAQYNNNEATHNILIKNMYILESSVQNPIKINDTAITSGDRNVVSEQDLQLVVKANEGVVTDIGKASGVK